MNNIIYDNEPFEKAREAIQNDDIAGLKKHLKDYEFYNTPDETGRNLLGYAVEFENINALKYLLSLPKIDCEQPNAVYTFEDDIYMLATHARPIDQLTFYQGKKAKHRCENFEKFKKEATLAFYEKRSQPNFDYFLECDDAKKRKIKLDYLNTVKSRRTMSRDFLFCKDR